jgi:hypothetical protein
VPVNVKSQVSSIGPLERLLFDTLFDNSFIQGLPKGLQARYRIGRYLAKMRVKLGKQESRGGPELTGI